jgi:hypothetical protein
MAYMGGESLGPWSPLPLSDAIELFSDYSGRWWIAGGRALELFVGELWREHEDTDIAILRQEVDLVRRHLASWDVQVAAAGKLSPWDGRIPNPELNENNMWCRPTPKDPWAMDLTVSDGDAICWTYRRDREIQIPGVDAVLVNADGVPYLAPELQLLFKSKHLRSKDTVDARKVIPRLSDARREWLSQHLSMGHPWRGLLT